MPLILMCGVPSSGKSRRTAELKDFFVKEHSKTVHVVSEEDAIKNAGFEKNSLYLDSQKEKHIRGVLKSEVMRLIDKDTIVILDSGNYIKGFRYELYCASKASKTTQCTVYTIINFDQAWTLNLNRTGDDITAKTYNKEVFDALIQRFEEPNNNNRWDSPLFVVGIENSPPFQAINSALYDRKPPPPNLSTQNAPLSSTNFLYEVDRITGDICDKMCPLGTGTTPARLRVLRRQFLTLAKSQYSSCDTDKIATLFTQYLNTTLDQ